MVANLTASQFAKAGQEESRNLDVSVLVSRSCTVSTERGAEGAQLEGACPGYAKQSLVRELVVGSAPRLDGAPHVGEQLYLVVNF
ncbi:MAG: hypothetical protein EOO73_24350 [Myxococcales bacterium]|nr:MAG: hypothetical protein EOO73_24350 [Myxococcales bacterium]